LALKIRSSNSLESADTSDTPWKVYKNPYYKFSFKYPSDVNIIESGIEGEDIIINFQKNVPDLMAAANENLSYDEKNLFSGLLIMHLNLNDDYPKNVCGGEDSVCYKDYLNSKKEYTNNNIKGFQWILNPYGTTENRITFTNNDKLYSFTISGINEGTFPSQEALDIRDQILATFDFGD